MARGSTYRRQAFNWFTAKTEMELQGVSVEAMAKELNLSSGIVASWLRGYGQPSPDKVRKMEEVLGAPAGMLVDSVTPVRTWS